MLVYDDDDNDADADAVAVVIITVVVIDNSCRAQIENAACAKSAFSLQSVKQNVFIDISKNIQSQNIH